jgi:hypothetical protein
MHDGTTTLNDKYCYVSLLHWTAQSLHLDTADKKGMLQTSIKTSTPTTRHLSFRSFDLCDTEIEPF